MKQKQILVFIEGEGGGRTTSKRGFLAGEFRKSWKQFLQPLADHATNKGIRRFQCIAGRGGSAVTDTFANPLPKDQGALRILIIDSEGPVADVSKPWAALNPKKRPKWATDSDCYLMVQCLEAWLLADRDGLKAHFDRTKTCFNEKKLKKWPNLEALDRKTVQRAISDATSSCKNPYGHADGNVLIAIVDREKLKSLPAVTRLFRDFANRIDRYAQE
ncbi:MAG TPA: DUF4276 family protein [Gemmataceae bacterium]|jgi:hypothetical protein|nr:DUF4276 family protein [Gemmataceae bacterium]